MPENNERFNYQSELLRGERYHSLPLATEDLSNLRRFIAPRHKREQILLGSQ